MAPITPDSRPKLRSASSVQRDVLADHIEHPPQWKHGHSAAGFARGSAHRFATSIRLLQNEVVTLAILVLSARLSGE